MENRLAKSLNTNVNEIEWELSPNERSESNDTPTELSPEDNATFQEEKQEKEAELDYGP
jgi:hypothetical protein